MKKFGKPILAFILFLIIQGIVTALAGIVALLINADALSAALQGNQDAVGAALMTPTFLGITLIISSLLTVLAIRQLKMMTLSKAFCTGNITTSITITAVIAALTGITATNILSEILDLPNIIEAQLTDMSSNIWGILAISIFGPIAEEVVFREAILGGTLRKGVKPWAAITFSALLFGLVHMNPAQIPFAFCVGLILGYIYYRTGNIVLTSIIHIINNGTSCLLMYFYGDKADDIKISDMLGGTMQGITAAVILAAVCVGVLYLFKKYTHKIEYTDQQPYTQDIPEPVSSDTHSDSENQIQD